MQDTDIRDILERSGIKADGELTVKPLDKFESTVVDIALRLIDDDDDMDPAHAGMDILDAVNAKMMNESWERRAGTYYDPMKRALALLDERLEDDVCEAVKGELAKVIERSYARIQGRSTGTSNLVKTMEPDTDSLHRVTTAVPPEDPTADYERIADELEAAARSAGQSHAMAPVIHKLRSMAGTKPKMFSGESLEEDELEIMRLAGMNEMCDACANENEGAPEREDLAMMLHTQRHVLGSIIPEIRGIAKHFVTDPNAKQRMLEIADQLGDLQWRIHGEKERGFGQLWTDVERQDPLWKGKV